MAALLMILACLLAVAALIAVLAPKKQAPLPPVDRRADEMGAPW